MVKNNISWTDTKLTAIEVMSDYNVKAVMVQYAINSAVELMLNGDKNVCIAIGNAYVGRVQVTGHMERRLLPIVRKSEQLITIDSNGDGTYDVMTWC